MFVVMDKTTHEENSFQPIQNNLDNLIPLSPFQPVIPLFFKFTTKNVRIGLATSITY